MREYRAGRANANRPDTYRTKTERRVVQQRELIMALPQLEAGEQLDMALVAARLGAKTSICEARLGELVVAGRLEKVVDGRHHRWIIKRNIKNPLSVLWVKGAYCA
jgi:hypothetical protein